MQKEFLEWLEKEAKGRGLASDRMISKFANISPSIISRVRNKQSPIGWEACTKIADAFNVPKHVVLMKAGHIDPPKHMYDADADQLVNMFQQLSKEDKEEIIHIVKFKANK